MDDAFNDDIRGDMDKTSKHREICKNLNEIYERKNKDYGDSFTKSFNSFGLTSSAIRLGDKFYRFENLIKSEEALVKDESIEDTLMDMANYCIMTLIEMEQIKEEIKDLDMALERVGELTFDE